MSLLFNDDIQKAINKVVSLGIDNFMFQEPSSTKKHSDDDRRTARHERRGQAAIEHKCPCCKKRHTSDKKRTCQKRRTCSKKYSQTMVCVKGTITLLALVHNSQATSDEIAVNKSNQVTRDALAVVAISNHLSNSCN